MLYILVLKFEGDISLSNIIYATKFYTALKPILKDSVGGKVLQKST